MVYTSRAVYSYQCFYSTTDVIVEVSDNIIHTETSYTKVIEFELANKIHPDSILDLFFQIRNEVGGHTTTSAWYLNGTLYSPEYTQTGVVWLDKTTDITTPLNRGDVLTLYSKTTAGGQASTRVHRIRGKSSPFSVSYIKP